MTIIKLPDKDYSKSFSYWLHGLRSLVPWLYTHNTVASLVKPDNEARSTKRVRKHTTCIPV